jgi:hypothetical protein
MPEALCGGPRAAILGVPPGRSWKHGFDPQARKQQTNKQTTQFDLTLFDFLFVRRESGQPKWSKYLGWPNPSQKE